MGLDLDMFPDDVPEDMVCAVCRKVLVNPVESTPCSHLFCAVCLKRHLKRDNTRSCPTCRVRLGHKTKAPSVPAKVKLLNLPVRCSFNCGKICRLGDMPDHVADDCPHAPVACPNVRKGCWMKVRREQLSEHVEECEYRTVTCEACGQRTVYVELFTHQSRKKCMEKKIRQQVIRAIRETNSDVAQHKRFLQRQHIRLEQHQRQRLMDHHYRQTGTNAATTTNKPWRQGGGSTYNHHQQHHSNSYDINGDLGGEGNCDNEYASDDISPHIDGLSAVEGGEEPPGEGRMFPDPVQRLHTNMFLTAGHQPNEDGELAIVFSSPHTARSMSSRVGMAIMADPSSASVMVSTCRNCHKKFREHNNSPNSCRWHPGPIIELFGGTCYTCGRLDYQQGCMMGFHEV